MNRNVACTVMLAVAASASAQCGMTSTFQANAACTSFGGTYAFAGAITGGTPPYSVQVQDGAYLRTTSTSGPAWATMDALPGNMGSATLTVTDNLGCVYNTTQSVTQQFVHSPILSVAPDCQSNGGILRWTGWNPGPPPYSPPCPESTIAYIDGQSTTIATAWTWEAPNQYRYNQALPPGNHQVFFVAPSACPGRLDCHPLHNVNVPVSTISIGDCGVNFRLRTALDGALPTGATLMTDALRSANLIPLVEPYSALGYSYAGQAPGAGVAPALLAVTGNDAIVDWLVVELRNTATTVAWSKPALLQRDGDVMDFDGNAYLNFPVNAGNYYVAVRHRNHSGIMTSTARVLSQDPAAALIDFRLTSTVTYGTAARVLKGTVNCLWAGDANGDGSLKYTGSANDRDPIILAIGGSTPNATVPNVYDRRDTNLDGVIKYTGTANDRDIILTNVGSTTPNNTRTQQLP